jgi:hypothetical protein
MRQKTLRRLEALEKEHRSREQRELSLLNQARFNIWRIVLAYYLGDLKADGNPVNDCTLPIEEDGDPVNGCTFPIDAEDYPVNGCTLPIHEAEARALNYPSERDYSEACLEAIRTKDTRLHQEMCERWDDACRRFFAKVGLDVDSTPLSVLFDAFVKMVNRLPDVLLNSMRSDPYADIAVGCNIPRGLSSDNFLLFRRR